jgi:hypothetical protein
MAKLKKLLRRLDAHTLETFNPPRWQTPQTRAHHLR